MAKLEDIVNQGHSAHQEDAGNALNLREMDAKYPFLREINAAWYEELGWIREVKSYSKTQAALQNFFEYKPQPTDEPETMTFPVAYYHTLQNIVPATLAEAVLNESGSNQQTLLLMAGLGVLKRHEFILPEDFDRADGKDPVVGKKFMKKLISDIEKKYKIKLNKDADETNYQLYRRVAELFFSVDGALRYYKNAAEPRPISQQEEQTLTELESFLVDSILEIYAHIGVGLINYKLTLAEMMDIKIIVEDKLAAAEEKKQFYHERTQKLVDAAAAKGFSVTRSRSLNRYLVTE
jgi:hypothetical protein